MRRALRALLSRLRRLHRHAAPEAARTTAGGRHPRARGGLRRSALAVAVRAVSSRQAASARLLPGRQQHREQRRESSPAPCRRAGVRLVARGWRTREVQNAVSRAGVAHRDRVVGRARAASAPRCASAAGRLRATPAGAKAEQPGQPARSETRRRLVVGGHGVVEVAARRGQRLSTSASRAFSGRELRRLQRLHRQAGARIAEDLVGEAQARDGARGPRSAPRVLPRRFGLAGGGPQRLDAGAAAAASPPRPAPSAARAAACRSRCAPRPAGRRDERGAQPNERGCRRRRPRTAAPQRAPTTSQPVTRRARSRSPCAAGRSRAQAAAVAPGVAVLAVAEVAGVGVLDHQLDQRLAAERARPAPRSRPCRATSAASRSSSACRCRG